MFKQIFEAVNRKDYQFANLPAFLLNLKKTLDR